MDDGLDTGVPLVDGSQGTKDLAGVGQVDADRRAAAARATAVRQVLREHPVQDEHVVTVPDEVGDDVPAQLAAAAGHRES